MDLAFCAKSSSSCHDVAMLVVQVGRSPVQALSSRRYAAVPCPTALAHAAPVARGNGAGSGISHPGLPVPQHHSRHNAGRQRCQFAARYAPGCCFDITAFLHG